MEQHKPFWMVWNPNGYQPTVKHSSFYEAEREAERLAKQHEDELFIVLKAVAICQVRRVNWTVLCDPNKEPAVPF